MTIVEVQADLFSDETNSLAHCVSADFAMGAGIARLFRKKFGRVKELLEQKKGVGEVAYLKDSSRYIFYLVTKEEYWHKPSYETLTDSLLELAKLCKDLKINKLSIPRIGCGLDMLDWAQVKEIVAKVFKDVEITVHSI